MLNVAKRLQEGVIQRNVTDVDIGTIEHVRGCQRRKWDRLNQESGIVDVSRQLLMKKESRQKYSSGTWTTFWPV